MDGICDKSSLAVKRSWRSCLVNLELSQRFILYLIKIPNDPRDMLIFVTHFQSLQQGTSSCLEAYFVFFHYSLNCFG